MVETELDISITDAMVDAAFEAWVQDTKNDKLAMRRAIRAALSLPVSNTGEWQPIETAPKDGTHCILAVKEDEFVYAVQGAFYGGHWNAVHRANVEPLCWMPNVRVPKEFLPWEKSE